MFFFRIFYRWITKRALKQVVQGRMISPGDPEAGRLLPLQVDEIFKATFAGVDSIMKEEPLADIPTLGNRHNVFLAVLTISIYHALLEVGLSRQRARVLLADAGWKLYVTFLIIPKTVARVLRRDPQRRMNIMLNMFLRFPFSAPGRPGYEVTTKEQADRFLTTWTYCPPYFFVKQYVEQHGDRGEMKAFQQSWCWFDWALSYTMMDGEDPPGFYQRPKTLSFGDDYCNMCWAARAPLPQPITAPDMIPKDRQADVLG